MALATVCLSMAPAFAAGGNPNAKGNCDASFQRDGPCGFGDFGGPQNWMLLVDDATRENLENMTLNQIKELRDEKTAQINNMTLAQIDELSKKQMEKLNNMTLAQIKEMKMGFKEMCPGMMGHGMMNHGMMGGQGEMGHSMMNQGADRDAAENGRKSGSQQQGKR
jgi:hypothetical protein